MKPQKYIWVHWHPDGVSVYQADTKCPQCVKYILAPSKPTREGTAEAVLGDDLRQAGAIPLAGK